MTNAAAAFAVHARHRPGAPALSGVGACVTYGELADRSRRCAAAYAARGVTPADRVALLLPNDPRFAVALLGAFWLGCTAVVLTPTWAGADIRRALDDADARLLITTEELAGVCGDPTMPTLLTDVEGRHSFDRTVDGAVPWGAEPVAREPSDVATVLFSSGTTSRPKGVALTHGNLTFNARSKAKYCGLTPHDRLALAVPLAHCFGQNVVLLGALGAGASVRMAPRFDAARLGTDIAAGEVTVLFGSPPVFQRLLDAGDPAAIRALRYALSAAAPLPAALADRWYAEQGSPLHQGYGLTECSPFATHHDASGGHDGTVGSPIDGVKVRIAAPDGGDPLGPGELGEVVIRGPNVMAGYWRRPVETATALRGGWLRTGDLGTMDDGGRLTLADRLDDVINVAGFKVYPTDVERALAAHPDVVEACAYAVPHEQRGSAVAAAVVLRRGSTAVEQGLVEHAAARLAAFQRPDSLRIVPTLPRTPSGKVMRRALQELDVPCVASRRS